MPVEVVIEEPSTLAETFVDRVERLAAASLSQRQAFALALPGGSAAEALLPVLAGARIDWARVHLFWGDERAVPPDHPDSNFGLAHSLWLKRASAEKGGPAAEHIHRMPVDAGDLDEAARRYEADLVACLGRPPALDIALLGVGPDGHVCSLFPGHPLLEDTARYVAPIYDSPKPPPRRLTLTLQALAAARLLVVAAFGQAKAAVVREALHDPASRLPLALALQRAPRSLLLLDPAAAA